MNFELENNELENCELEKYELEKNQLENQLYVHTKVSFTHRCTSK